MLLASVGTSLSQIGTRLFAKCCFTHSINTQQFHPIPSGMKHYDTLWGNAIFLSECDAGRFLQTTCPKKISRSLSLIILGLRSIVLFQTKIWVGIYRGYKNCGPFPLVDWNEILKKSCFRLGSLEGLSTWVSHAWHICSRVRLATLGCIMIISCGFKWARCTVHGAFGCYNTYIIIYPHLSSSIYHHLSSSIIIYLSSCTIMYHHLSSLEKKTRCDIWGFPES